MVRSAAAARARPSKEVVAVAVQGGSHGCGKAVAATMAVEAAMTVPRAKIVQRWRRRSSEHSTRQALDRSARCRMHAKDGGGCDMLALGFATRLFASCMP